MTATNHLAYIGLGGNLAQPERAIESALTELAAIENTRLAAYSSLYRSAPLDVPDAQPDYINAVALLHTGLSPQALLSALQTIEARHGARAAYRNAPRLLDLDLLLYDALVIDSRLLALPHPRAHERAFVLAPLIEIAPQIAIPGRGAARALLAAIAAAPEQRIERLRAAHPAAVESLSEPVARRA
jgi:2-amino-4-hydroxy-6-hydroxymethyldihydropteridine diphosphokinase